MLMLFSILNINININIPPVIYSTHNNINININISRKSAKKNNIIILDIIIPDIIYYIDII